MTSPDDVPEELASLPTIAHPTVSPDGDRVALYYDGSGRNELHVLDVDDAGDVTGEALPRWSDGEVPRNARWPVAWSADGDRVFFHLDDAGDEQNDIYAIDGPARSAGERASGTDPRAADGDVETVVEMDGQNQLMDVGEDGETLLVGSSRDGQLNVYRHDLPTDETTKVTDNDRAVHSAVLSPDGDRMAFATNERDDYDNVDVYVADVDGSDPRNLDVGDVGAEAAPVEWHPEGDALLVSDNSTDLGRAGVYDLETDEITWLGGDEYEETPQCFLPDGERVVVTRSRDASVVPVVYDVATGDRREFDVPDGVATFGMGPAAGEWVVGDDEVMLMHTSPTRRPRLLTYDLAADEYEVLLPAEYGPFEPEDFADAEYVTFDSDGVPETRQAAAEHDPYDELEIGGLLYDSGGRPSPLIVNPHGGPRHRDTKSFDLYTQFLVSLGYSVLQVNYRGSTGRGREFVRELYDDWAGAEQGDVAVGAEHVIATREWLDEDRVVVFGGSYGGYSAYWQMVQYPDMYAAGIAWIGLTDLEDMFENTMPHFRTELMEKNLGTPENEPELYRERSPVTHVENVSAPLLQVHGVNDRRVPVSQARIFREALLEAGYEEGVDGDFEYVELGEEGHASSDIDQKIRMFRTLADFLERRLPAATRTATADD